EVGPLHPRRHHRLQGAVVVLGVRHVHVDRGGSEQAPEEGRVGDVADAEVQVEGAQVGGVGRGADEAGKALAPELLHEPADDAVPGPRGGAGDYVAHVSSRRATASRGAVPSPAARAKAEWKRAATVSRVYFSSRTARALRPSSARRPGAAASSP